jgi:hypothetical protein
MRSEYAALRRAAKAYGFGFVVNLQPVKSCDQAIAKYLSKYVAKHLGRRELRDKGVRLVGYWGHAAAGRVARCGLQFKSPRSCLWRYQLKEFAGLHGCEDLDALKARFGPRWAYNFRSEIMGIEPPEIVCRVVNKGQGDDERLETLRDVWEGDRMASAKRIAQSVGCTPADAYMYLYQSDAVRLIESRRSPELSSKSDGAKVAAYLAFVERSNAEHAKRIPHLNDVSDEVETTRVMWSDAESDSYIVERVASVCD